MHCTAHSVHRTYIILYPLLISLNVTLDSTQHVSHYSYGPVSILLKEAIEVAINVEVGQASPLHGASQTGMDHRTRHRKMAAHFGSW